MKLNFFKAIGVPMKVVKLVIDLIIVYAPGSVGGNLRSKYYKKKFKSCGENVTIEPGVIFNGIEYISIGNNVVIDKYCIINAGPLNTGKIQDKPNPEFKFNEGELRIGNNIHIAPFCLIAAQGGVVLEDYCAISSGIKIYSASNTLYDPEFPKRRVEVMPLGHSNAPFLVSPVVIKENVWLGLQCIIMPGTTIGKDVFAMSNSFLMGTYDDNSYIAGQPAKKVKERFIYE